MTTDSTAYLETLHGQIDSRFNMEEIQSLCFRLGIDYENVPGKTRSAVIRNLIVSLAKSNRLQELVVLVRKERPNWNDWQDVPSDFALPRTIAQEDIRQVTQYTVYGDSVTVGNISNSSGIAIGGSASASVNRGAVSEPTDRPDIGGTVSVGSSTRQAIEKVNHYLGMASPNYKNLADELQASIDVILKAAADGTSTPLHLRLLKLGQLQLARDLEIDMPGIERVVLVFQDSLPDR